MYKIHSSDFMENPGVMQQTKRWAQIISTLVKYGFTSWVKRLKLETGRPEEKIEDVQGEEIWKRLRLALEELGPTFIKFGQMLSNRPDLLPRELISELEQLQDAVPPVTVEEIKEVIKEDFEKTAEEVFFTFDNEPYAAASIAQVHRAKLEDGRLVAVKIQRPDIRIIVDSDIQILRKLAKLIEDYTDEFEVIHPVSLVEEFDRVIHEELDFSREAMNMLQFRHNFKDEERIIIPKIYKSLSTSRVLTMNFYKGFKITEIDEMRKAGIDPRIVADTGSELFFQQLFDHGFYHADPHPGNMLILENNRICYLDFGMTGRITPSDRDLLGNIFISIAQKDLVRMLRTLRTFAPDHKIDNERKLEYQLQELMDRYTMQNLKDVNMNDLTARFRIIVLEHRLNIPPDFFLLLRSLAILEGTARKLDPDYNIVNKMQPYLVRLYKKKLDPATLAKEAGVTALDLLSILKDLPYDLKEIFRKIREGTLMVEFQHKGLESMMRTLISVSNKLSAAIILASIVIGSSLLVFAGIPPKWYEVPVFGIIGFFLAGIIGLWLIITFYFQQREMQKKEEENNKQNSSH
jgi:ubiquinone biosynthesis protein